MTSDKFRMLWDKIPKARQQQIISDINHFVNEALKKPDSKPNHPYSFKRNFAFDQDDKELIQYIYVEGGFIVVNRNHPFMTGISSELQINMNFIEVGDEANNFLDRRDEIKALKGENLLINDIYSGVEKSNSENVDIEKELKTDSPIYYEVSSEEIQIEMMEMIDEVKKTPEGAKVSYEHLQVMFLVGKVSELQSQINELKSNLK